MKYKKGDTIVVTAGKDKGKKGKIHIPVEVLLLCPSQTVTNDQMINNEQADMIKVCDFIIL